jgi:hypothetical protein
MDKRHHMHYHATPYHAKGGRDAKPSPNDHQRCTMIRMSRIEMSMLKIQAEKQEKVRMVGWDKSR